MPIKTHIHKLIDICVVAIDKNYSIAKIRLLGYCARSPASLVAKIFLILDHSQHENLLPEDGFREEGVKFE